MISALLALLASAAFGASDFIAGITSRRISPVAVALWSQLAGAAALLVALALSGQRPEASGIAWGAASGVVAAVGVLLFYRALAIGPTSVISPVVASGVAIPVLVGVFGGELPSAVVVVGLLDVCCVVGEVERRPSETQPKGESDDLPRAYRGLGPPGRGGNRLVLPDRRRLRPSQPKRRPLRGPQATLGL